MKIYFYHCLSKFPDCFLFQSEALRKRTSFEAKWRSSVLYAQRWSPGPKHDLEPESFCKNGTTTHVLSVGSAHFFRNSKMENFQNRIRPCNSPSFRSRDLGSRSCGSQHCRPLVPCLNIYPHEINPCTSCTPNRILVLKSLKWHLKRVTYE